MKKSIVIIGEGPTEFFYFNSLKDRFRGLQIKPEVPTNTSLAELENKIIACRNDGATYIYCIIDMDNKHNEPAKSHYKRLKAKYQGEYVNRKKGIHCHIRFIETDRCTELFFLYYFKYTKKEYFCSDNVCAELANICGYEKNIKFFQKHPLNAFFIQKGGCLDVAIENANKSVLDKEQGSFSEIGELMLELDHIINPQHKKCK